MASAGQQARQAPPTAGSAASRSAAGGAGAPGGEETEDEERMRLLQKIKDAGSGPEMAARKIRNLDVMVKRLQDSRKAAAEQIEQDSARLAYLDQNRAVVDRKYQALLKRVREREVVRDRIAKQLDDVTSQFHGLLSTTKERERKTRLQRQRFMAKEASEALVSTRGFTTDRRAGLLGSPSALKSGGRGGATLAASSRWAGR